MGQHGFSAERTTTACERKTALFRLLPATLSAKLRSAMQQHKTLWRVTENTGWLFVDRVLRMAAVAVVGIWGARYLGPVQYGLLSYATAFVGLFAAFAPLGLNDIVVRELVRVPDDKHSILGTAFVLQLVGGTATLLLATVAILLLRPTERHVHWLVVLLAAVPLFNAFGAIGFWFQSRVESRLMVLGKGASLLLSPVLGVALILVRAPLVAFAAVGPVEAVIGAIGLVVVYQRTGGSMRRWRFRLDVARQLLVAGWPLLLSGIAIMIYMRIDQVLVAELAGDRAAGLYGAAVRISEIWYFVPTTIVSSLFPVLVAGKGRGGDVYYRRFQKTFRLMAFLSLLVAIPMTFASSSIVALLFGEGYREAGQILAIHVWAGLPVAMGVATTPWLVSEGLTQISLQKALLGAVVNVILCLLLIPRYAGIGAAIATVAAYTATTFVWHLADPRIRHIGMMQVKAFLPTWSSR